MRYLSGDEVVQSVQTIPNMFRQELKSSDARIFQKEHCTPRIRLSACISRQLLVFIQKQTGFQGSWVDLAEYQKTQSNPFSQAIFE